MCSWSKPTTLNHSGEKIIFLAKKHVGMHIVFQAIRKRMDAMATPFQKAITFACVGNAWGVLLWK